MSCGGHPTIFQTSHFDCRLLACQFLQRLVVGSAGYAFFGDDCRYVFRGGHVESRIFDEDQRPRPDSEALMRLKIEKLRLKEEMERLRTLVD